MKAGPSFGTLRHVRTGLAALLVGAGLPLAAAAADLEPSGFRIVHAATAHDAVFDIGFDGALGIAVGAAGQVLISEDAGASWKTDEAQGVLALLGVDVHAGRSLAVGQGGQIYRRSDGAWSKVESGSEDRLLAVDSEGGDLAVAVGGFGCVLVSRDGGTTWTRRTFDWESLVDDFIEPHLYAVDVRGDVVTIAGELGLVMRSEDTGTTWQKLRQGEESLFDMHLLEGGRGYAVGQKGLVMATDDGGRTWTQLDVKSDANLLGVWANAGGQVLVTGIRAALYSADGGASWRPLEAGDISVSWYQTAAGTRDGVPGLIVGHSGRIINIVGAIENLAR